MGSVAIEPVHEPKCPVADILRPASYSQFNQTLHRIVHSPEFREQSARKLSDAVKVDTSTDDNAPGVEEDEEYWRSRFEPFHAYLESTFPRLWEFADVEKVNTWGLVITWKGSDDALKPIVLTAHQDVVPIQQASLGEWEHPPFEGIFDGDKLFGRGLADCKNLLVGLLETAEELEAAGFEPKRTIVFAFGFDEEIGGGRGAYHIGKHLLNRYGPDGAYAVIDEGGQSLVLHGDVALALIGTSEKGLSNVYVGLSTPGGHSSVPPDHTSIGIVSDLVTRFERQPFHPVFTPRNPTFFQWQCVAEHLNTLLAEIRNDILHSDSDKCASQNVAKWIYNSDLTDRYLVTTSQAVDIINGGVKSNALPEYVEVVINHRIAVELNTKEVFERDVALVTAVARQFDLGLVVNNETVLPTTKNGHFNVWTTWVLDPAPFTPLYDEHWSVFAGTLRHVYEEVCKGTMREFENKHIIPSPGMAAGNTDTQYYWNLTKHIYRYRPGLVPSVQAHAHGANEHIIFDSHLQIIAFYFEYLQAVDDLS